MKPNKQPMPPVDDPRFTNGKRGKSFPVPKANWGSDPDFYSPGLGPQVLHEALGGWGGNGDTDDA